MDDPAFDLVIFFFIIALFLLVFLMFIHVLIYVVVMVVVIMILTAGPLASWRVDMSEKHSSFSDTLMGGNYDSLNCNVST